MHIKYFQEDKRERKDNISVSFAYRVIIELLTICGNIIIIIII